MKGLAIATGLLMALTTLPALAAGEMDQGAAPGSEIILHLEEGDQHLGSGDIIAFDEPLILDGTVEMHRNGLIHINTDHGTHLIVSEPLAFEKAGAPSAASILKQGDPVSVEIPSDHNWVMTAGADVPFASMFGGDVILLGGYDGCIWMTPGDLNMASLEYVASAGGEILNTAIMESEEAPMETSPAPTRDSGY